MATTSSPGAVVPGTRPYFERCKHRARGGEADGAARRPLRPTAWPSSRRLREWRRRRGRARPSRRPAARRAGPGRRCRAHAASLRARRGIRGSSPTASRCPSCNAVPGMSSTLSISSIRSVVLVAPGRRETHAAVAHDDSGRAVPGRRRDLRVPGDLAVVVRVHVDPSGSHESGRRRRSRVQLCRPSPVLRSK